MGCMLMFKDCSHRIHHVVGQGSKEGHRQTSLEDIDVAAEAPLPRTEVFGDAPHLEVAALFGEG